MAIVGRSLYRVTTSRVYSSTRSRPSDVGFAIPSRTECPPSSPMLTTFHIRLATIRIPLVSAPSSSSSKVAKKATRFAAWIAGSASKKTRSNPAASYGDAITRTTRKPSWSRVASSSRAAGALPSSDSSNRLYALKLISWNGRPPSMSSIPERSRKAVGRARLGAGLGATVAPSVGAVRGAVDLETGVTIGDVAGVDVPQIGRAHV